MSACAKPWAHRSCSHTRTSANTGCARRTALALNAEIEKHTVKRTSAEWIEHLNEAGVPCGPIYTIDKMFADPQVQTPRHGKAARAPPAG